MCLKVQVIVRGVKMHFAKPARYVSSPLKAKEKGDVKMMEGLSLPPP